MRSSPSTTADLGIDFEATRRGIKVTGVTPGSPAERIGLEAGDVIESLYGHPTTNRETWDWLTSYPGGYAPLRVRDVRTGAVVTRYVTLD